MGPKPAKKKKSAPSDQASVDSNLSSSLPSEGPTPLNNVVMLYRKYPQHFIYGGFIAFWFGVVTYKYHKEIIEQIKKWISGLTSKKSA